MDSIVTIIPRQHLEIHLSSGRIRVYIKVQDNGKESAPRKINFKPHTKEICICTSEFNIFTPGVDEEIREVALLAQAVRKLPISRRKPQTLFATRFQVIDEDLKNFLNDIAGGERVNSLYEVLSMISNYCGKYWCWVEHNDQAVICDRSLNRALGFGGFLWTDLAQMLLDKAKIAPATEAQMIESDLRFPIPPITSIPGAQCNSPKTILDTAIDPGKEYVIPSGFRTIFIKIRNRLNQHERIANPIKMKMARLEQTCIKVQPACEPTLKLPSKVRDSTNQKML